MTDWQERITRETEPAIRAEHDLRYRLAAPLIRSSEVWADLGCGGGIAAAAAIGEEFAGRAVLVDLDAAAVGEAGREVHAGSVETATADLSKPEEVARVLDAVLEGDRDPVTITCFEVVEHLADFVPLLRSLSEHAEAGRATTILSVPNDAFWALENPHHQTMWGEGSFAELRSLAPEGHVVARQLALTGSAVALEETPDREEAVDLALRGAEAIPTHFLLAFGPRAADLVPGSLVGQTDLREQRRWERQRESNLAYMEVALAELRAEREGLLQALEEREQFRAYIHELEERLGLPRSGTPERAAYDAAQASPGELPAPSP